MSDSVGFLVAVRRGPAGTGAGGSMVSDATLAEMVRRGTLTAALRPPGPPPATEAVGRLDDVLAALDEARADR